MDHSDTPPLEDSPSTLSEQEAPKPERSRSSKGKKSSPKKTAQQTQREVREKNYELFSAKLEELADPEAKIRAGIAFMEQSLNQEGVPHFKNFWAAGKFCMDTLKEIENPLLRSAFREQYVTLSSEARRLKALLDEQTSFTAEQIEIAIAALEKELAEWKEDSEGSPFDLPHTPRVLQRYLKDYERIQRELNFLNTQASRVQALRKELTTVEMRARAKNDFFRRLSAAGEQLFPKRRDLIKTISEQFQSDIDLFAKGYAHKETLSKNVRQARDEVKLLQYFAKSLTLNQKAFSHVRTTLSNCWDTLKDLDQERHAQMSAQKEEWSTHAKALADKIQAFSDTYAAGGMSVREAEKALNELQDAIQENEVGRDLVRSLQRMIRQAAEPVIKQQAAEEAAHKERIKKEQEELASAKTALFKQLEQVEKDQALAISACEEVLSAVREKGAVLSWTKQERMQFDRLLRKMNDQLAARKEDSLLDLSEDSKAKLISLKDILKKRALRRQEIRQRLQELRKEEGLSGLDFEKAITLRGLIEDERAQLAQLEESLEELQKQIEELK